MIVRQIADSIRKTLAMYPVLAITGPRQSGKTTMLKTMFADYRYISLENPDIRQYAIEDPNRFLQEFDDKVIFDEVQRVPELFSYIQTLVDKSDIMGQYILSGSQNFNLMERISQSLAGRVAIFKLLPLSIHELSAQELPSNNFASSIIKGGYPAIYSRQIPTTTFFNNYIQTYVERDLRELLKVKDLNEFKRFLKLCAGRVGQQLNLSNLSKDAGISLPTVNSWLSMLETSYITYQLPPFFNNFNKRLVKSNKLYFYDTGLACYLLGIKNEESLHKSPFKGSLFENLIINEYFKSSYNANDPREFYYWRDSNGHEVDLLMSNDTVYDIIEIKSTQTILPALFEGLDKLRSFGQSSIGNSILVYGGNDSQNRTQYDIRAWNQAGFKN